MEPSQIPEPTLERLTRYLVGELTDEERTAFERELARSPELREECAMLRQVLHAVTEAAPDSAPLTDEQRADLREAAGAGSAPRPRRPRPTLHWLAPLAIAATVVLAAFLVLQQGDEPSPARRGELAGRTVESAQLSEESTRTLATGVEFDQRRVQLLEQITASRPKESELRLAGRADLGTEGALLALDPQASEQTIQLRTTLESTAGGQIATVTATGAAPAAGVTNEVSRWSYGLPPAGAGGTAGPVTGGGGAGPGAPGPATQGPPMDGLRGGTELFYAGGEPRDYRARVEQLFDTHLGEVDFLEALGQISLGDAPTAGARGLGLERGGFDDGRRAVRSADDIFQALARRPGETPDMMFFRYWGDNPSIRTELDPQSTFALDVDTASYSLIRNYLSQGILPPKEAVRTEEFVNSFRYDQAPPQDGVFSFTTEVGPSPFGSAGMQLVRVGLKAREVTREARKPVALTFVIDVSGSMQRENRLALVQQALGLLVDQFDERDTIGIVTFQSTAQQVLAPHSIQHKNLILAAIQGLQAGGSTNAGDGLLLGYQMALGQFRDEAENRILLLSDGVANTGITDVDGILQSVEKYREGRIYLNSVGVGMGNHNDALLEQLADKGDGFYAYVDTMDEARRIFVDRLVGSMQTVAKDARVQVEWNPEAVSRYRLLGYENRAVADQDFRNTAIDAGEIGAGHEVTALYEIERRPETGEGPLATLRLFYQEPESDAWVEQERVVPSTAAAAEVGQTSPSFRLAAAVAEFAELLRQSIWARDGSLGGVLTLAEPLVAEFDGDEDVAGFVALVRQAAALPDLLPVRTDLTRTVNEFKRNQHLRAMLEDLKHQQDDPLLRQLEEENRELEQRIRDLIEQRLKDG